MPHRLALAPRSARIREWKHCTLSFFFFLFALVDSNIQEKATSEKLRLEEKQRKVRKEREAKGIEWTPRWFKQELDKDSGEMCWFFQDDYWDSRETGKYTDVADIF